MSPKECWQTSEECTDLGDPGSRIWSVSEIPVFEPVLGIRPECMCCLQFRAASASLKRTFGGLQASGSSVNLLSAASHASGVDLGGERRGGRMAPQIGPCVVRLPRREGSLRTPEDSVCPSRPLEPSRRPTFVH